MYNDKKDIENYGVEKFIEECKVNVRLNEDKFVEFTHRMGQFIDTDNAYITFKNSYSKRHISGYSGLICKDQLFRVIIPLPIVPFCISLKSMSVIIYLGTKSLPVETPYFIVN